MRRHVSIGVSPIDSLPCESVNAISKSRLEAPLRLGTVIVRCGCVPSCSRGMIPAKILLHSWTAMMVLIRSGAAERAKLKNMSLAELRRGPLQTALNDEESASWLQVLENKVLVRHSQPQLFDPEVRHPLDHQPLQI